MLSIVLAKDGSEHPIPEELHPTFRRIAVAFAAGDFQLHAHPIVEVWPIREAKAKFFRECADSYGDPLAPLNDAIWERSIYRWMDSQWHFVVDLSTANEPVSDLAIHGRLDEASGKLHIDSVHVP